MRASSSRRVVAIGLVVFVTACVEASSPEDVSSQSFAVDTEFVDPRSSWSYWYQGEDLGTAWRAHDWVPAPGGASGAGPLGYGESYVHPIPFGADASQKPITVYFRRDFFIDDPAEVTSLELGVMYDDGFVAYVNGQEAVRAAMPAGAVTFTTRASGHEANQAYVSFDVTGVRTALQAGNNTLAIEVHQADPSSSDLVFDAALTGDVGSPPPPPAPSESGIPRGASWSYWDRGGDLGSAWRGNGFDASGWASGAGPLGYGESYLGTTVSFGPSATSKYITTYFRTQFTVADPSAVTALLGEVMYDDGFVVYLNGTRFGSEGMPSGTTTASTLASGHEAGNAYRSYDWTVQRPLLVAGVNTIAVEVHQQSASSSDLVFDLALTVETGTPPPPPPPGGVQVCATGAPFTRIRDAIAAAPAGETIVICPGTYVERLTISGKPLRLIGTGGAAVTIVDGSAGGRVLDVSSTGGTGVYLEGLTLRNGSTSTTGAGIRCTGSTLGMNHSVVRGNTAGSGGGLAASSCVLDIQGTLFDHNRGRDRGGGALIEHSSGQLSGNELVGNRGVNGGGLATREGTVTIQGNDLHDNVADLRGGGLYHDSDASIIGNTFTDNDSGWTGGGLHIIGHSITVRDNLVTGNDAINDGGGIYVHQGSPLLVENRFERNHTGDDGGGIRIYDSRCRLEANTLIANLADDTGAGIRISHLPCQVTDNIVRDNIARVSGGGMDLDNDSSVVRGGVVTGNRAITGGGISIGLGPYRGAAVEDVYFAENRGTRGGAIFMAGNYQPVRLRGLTFENNTAADGAALYVTGTTFTLTRSAFRGNVATSHAGAIFAGRSDGKIGSIGFIAAYGNSAPSGAAIWTSSSSLTIANSIFYANPGGPQIRASGAIPGYRYNDTSPATFNGMASPVGSGGNISANPLFVDPGNTDFRLGSGSPCIDAGDPALRDGDGSRADMGMFGGP